MGATASGRGDELVDAGGALDQEAAPRAVARARKGVVERLQLRLALQQMGDRGRLAPHKRGGSHGHQHIDAGVRGMGADLAMTRANSGISASTRPSG
jgi:hypothetical protein